MYFTSARERQNELSLSRLDSDVPSSKSIRFPSFGAESVGVVDGIACSCGADCDSGNDNDDGGGQSFNFDMSTSECECAAKCGRLPLIVKSKFQKILLCFVYFNRVTRSKALNFSK